MNYLRVHAAAKRRFLANRDILGLLKNGRHRRSKKKTKGPVPTKTYGIFSKALSFKVLLHGESGDDPTQNEVVVIPIGHIPKNNPTQQTNKKKKNTAKIRKGQPNYVKKPTKETDLIPPINHNDDQNQTVLLLENTNQHDAGLSEFANEISSTMNHSEVTEHQIPSDFNDFNESGYITPVEFGIDSTAKTINKRNATPLRTISFDTVIVPDLQEHNNDMTSSNIDNNFDGSIGFNSIENQFRASDSEPPTVFSYVQNDFSATDTDKNTSSEYDSGWSLNTPDLTQESTSEESLDSFISRQANGFEHTHNQSIQTQSQIVFTPVSTQPILDINSNAISTTFNRNINNNNEKNWEDLPKLTMEMVIERKRMGARCAYERLFGTDPPSGGSSILQCSSGASHSTHTSSNKTVLPTSTFGSFNTQIEGNSLFSQTKRNKPKEIPNPLTKEVVMQRKCFVARRLLDRLLRENYKHSGSTSMQIKSKRKNTNLVFTFGK